MSLEIWMADYVIDNNGSLEDLKRNTRELITRLVANHQAATQNQIWLNQLRSSDTQF
jgi:hypothetical protein